LLFNTKYYFELLDRLSRGSVQQRLNQETLKDLIVPFIEQEKQIQISVIIEESFQLKNQSEHLLEVAKKAVEMAIEEGEEMAMEWMAEMAK
jgi:restriction endonuclease S subunit